MKPERGKNLSKSRKKKRGHEKGTGAWSTAGKIKESQARGVSAEGPGKRVIILKGGDVGKEQL